MEEKDFIKKLDEELEMFKYSIMSKTREEIYYSYYKINIYEEFYNYLLNHTEDLDFNELPKDNILKYFFDDFIDTDYNLTNEDLYMFFYDRLNVCKEKDEDMDVEM